MVCFAYKSKTVFVWLFETYQDAQFRSMGLYILVALGGVLAGFIGTLAGLGSVVSLYLLIDVIELDPAIANGTNRLGIMAMALMALPTFHKKGHLDLERSWPIILSIFMGAIIGFFLATQTDNQSLRDIFKYLLPFMLLLVMTNPKKWIQQTDPKHQLNYWLSVPIFIIMGLYAGFIQLGTGVFLVVFLALAGKYSLVDANGVKLSAFALYTFFGILIFAYYQQIDWFVGAVLAIGQGTGAYISARFATTYPKANGFVRYLLMLVLIIAIVRMFNLYQFFL